MKIIFIGDVVGRKGREALDEYIPEIKKTFNPDVIIVNAEKVLLTGNKEEQKEYFKHTNYPGGAKTASLKLLRTKNPKFILQNSIKGMLPHNRLGRKILEHLKIYIGEEHPHSAQKPSKLEL